MTSVITCRNLSKRFRIPRVAQTTLKGRVLHPFDRTTHDKFDALHDVSFDVREGEFFGIVGRNGSGKSTLLKILAGIYRQDEGSVDIDGSLGAFIELGVGFSESLSGRDNLFINGALMGMSKRHLQKRYDDIVKFAGLENFMDMKLLNFSSGMQVRLAFSIAIEAGTDILLTDEVLAVGDANFQRKCYEVFQQRKREGKTIIFVSHDMAAVSQLCDRVMLLDTGRVEFIGSAGEAVRKYQNLNQDRDASGRVVIVHKTDDQRATVRDMWSGNKEGDRTRRLQHGERMTVAMRVRFDEAVTDPSLSLIMTNSQGTEVINTSTAAHGMMLGDLQVGEEIVATFSLENHLAAGDYGISGLVTLPNEHGTVIGGSTAASKVTVAADRTSEGIYDPPMTIDVTRISSSIRATVPALT